MPAVAHAVLAQLLAGAVLSSRLTATSTESLHRLGAPAELGRHLPGAASDSTAALPAAVHDAVNAAFIDALHLALRCGSAALAAAALLVALLLRPPRSAAP
ncbi:hypothetical protein [Streptomyces virginiae]